MIRRVVVDMDMVLVDFISAIENRFKCKLEDKFGYDIGRALDRSWEVIKYDLDVEFWAGAPPMHWAGPLMKYLKHEIDEVYVATAADPLEEHIRGKMLWMGIWFPEYVDKMIFIKQKYLMAKAGVLLIDDYAVNTRKWEQEGGIAIRVPSRWYCSSEDVAGYDIVKEVDKCMNR